MDFITVTCNQCGAPLEVSRKSRFVTCTFCQSHLEIHHSETAVFTEILEQIDQRAETLSSDVSIIRKQNELAQLDREWQARQASFAAPSKAGSAAGYVASIVFLGLFVVLGFFMLRVQPIFGLLWLTAVIVIATQVIRTASRAGQISDAERDYKRRREEILRDIRSE